MPAFVELHACFDKCEKATPSAATDGNPFADIYLSVPVLIKTEQIVGIAPLFNGSCVNLKDKQECMRVVESPSEILASINSDNWASAPQLVLALVLGAVLATAVQHLLGQGRLGRWCSQALATLRIAVRSR